MHRLSSAACWALGAATSAAAYWYFVVYPFDEFNHGYGQDNWFMLKLYLSAISIVCGLIGYAAVALFRVPPRAFMPACLAGIAFTMAEVVLGAVLERALPDRDVMAQMLAGALVLGGLSSVVPFLRAAGR